MVDGRNFVIHMDHNSVTFDFKQKLEKFSISQFTTNIRYAFEVNKVVFNAFSRVEALLSSIDFEALPKDQQPDSQHHEFRQKDTGLILKKMHSSQK